MKMSENRPSLAFLKLDLKLYYTLDKYISMIPRLISTTNGTLLNYWLQVNFVFCILFCCFGLSACLLL